MSGTPDMLSHMGGVPVGLEVLQPQNVEWLYSSTSAAPYAKMSETKDLTKMHATLALAYAATTSGRNDIVFVTPETHTLTAGITWANSNTHLIGMHSGSRWANNCKITHTSALSINAMLTVTGSDNIFQNLHIQHGVGSQVANLTAVRISGAGNLFENCWIEGPCDNSVADLATARLVQLGGGGNTFRNCVFGSTSVFRSAAGSLVEFYTGTYRATFEDCLFYCHVDASTPTMIYIKTNKAIGSQFWRNCQFVSHSTGHATAMEDCIGAQTSDSSGQYCFLNCSTAGINRIAGSGAGWPGLAVCWSNESATTASAGRAIIPTT
jgi:hypothetical protein